MKNYELIQITERYNTIVAKASTAYALGAIGFIDAELDNLTGDYCVKVKIGENFPSDVTLSWRAEANSKANQTIVEFNDDQADALEEYLDEVLARAKQNAEQRLKIINALNS